MSENTPKRRATRRAPQTAWQPGQSGNPGGRPKLLANVRDLAREHTEAAVKTLAHVMNNGKSDSARARAAEALLDRGWGRPYSLDESQTLVVVERKPVSLEEVEDLARQTIAAAERARARAARGLC